MCGHIPAKGGINQLFSGNVCKVCTVTNLIRKGPNGFSDDPNDEVVSVEVEADIALAKEETLSASLGWDKPDEEFELKKSFNEDVKVEFYPIAHQYWIGDTRLKSVTRLKSSMYAPFDDSIANNCVNSWGLPAQDIKDMWKLNGLSSSGIGTAIHGYMEMYQRYGLKMPEDKRVKALPKIGMFRDIVLSFPWNCLTVHTEVLVTDVERGLCGLVDRAVEADDGIRIEDYKFNAEWDVVSTSKHGNPMFPDLPANKLNGYLIQLSIYADMIEKSGMKVADTVVAHIWDGSWHLKEMGRIHGIVDIIKSRTGA